MFVILYIYHIPIPFFIFPSFVVELGIVLRKLDWFPAFYWHNINPNWVEITNAEPACLCKYIINPNISQMDVKILEQM